MGVGISHKMHTKLFFIPQIAFASFWLTLALGQAKGMAQNPVLTDEVEAKNFSQYLLPILKAPRFADLDWPVDQTPKADHGYVFLPPEKPEHPQGIYRLRGIMAGTDGPVPLEGQCLNGGVEWRVLDKPAVLLAEDQSRQVAITFLKEHFTWFFEGESPTMSKAEKSKNTDFYSFHWRRKDNRGFLTSKADAWVRKIDGRIVGFDVIKSQIPQVPFKITPNQARDVAAKAIQDNKQYSGAKINGVELLIDAQKQPRYKVYASWTSTLPVRVARTVLGTIVIDSMTGKYLPKESDWDEIDSMHGDTPRANFQTLGGPLDSAPVWTNSGLLFRSRRKLNNAPEWITVPEQAMISGPDGKIFYLTCDLQMTTESLRGLPNGNWLTLQRQGWSYAFDLSTGSYRVLGHPLRDGKDAAVNAVGERAIVSSSGRAVGNFDLFADDLNRGVDLQLPARLVADGPQISPIFSIDGAWLYFISTVVESLPKETGDNAPKRLPRTIVVQRIPSDIVQAKKLTRIPPKKSRLSLVVCPNFHNASVFSLTENDYLCKAEKVCMCCR